MIKLKDTEGAVLPGSDKKYHWHIDIYEEGKMSLGIPSFFDAGEHGCYDSEGVLVVNLQDILELALTRAKNGFEVNCIPDIQKILTQYSDKYRHFTNISIPSKPIVQWQSPETTPDVPKGETKTFWIATRFKRKDEWKVVVFDAQYVNKPLEYAEDDIDKEYPLDDDHFVNEDGEAMEAMGWHSLMEHADFHGYYEPIVFSDERELLGWGEYQKPEFKL